jgi:DNA-binding MarR family transcriptional regulator
MAALTADEYHALASFRHLMRRFLRFSKDFLRDRAGLTPEQYEALLAVKAFADPKGFTISQLSERLQVKHHSAVNIVDRLAERKFVTRETGATDRRERNVQLTGKGAALLEELASVHRRELRERCPDMIKALERLRK